MYNHFLLLASAYSVIIPAIIGAIRFPKILKSYRPFVILIWVALFNEILSSVIIRIFKNDAINNNIYTLADYTLLVLIFMFWDEGRRLRRYYILFAFGLVVWVTDNLILHSLSTFSSYFRIIYGIIIVFLSVEAFNGVLFSEVRTGLKNAKLLICISFIIAYTYQAVFEIFGVVNIFSIQFYQMLYLIPICVNLLTNLLYGIAMLWVPTKRQFTLPY